MKLRITEKVLECVINTGLERYGESTFDGKIRKTFESDVTECMRLSVYGNEEIGRKTQWKFR
jgi:hypothetical protein